MTIMRISNSKPPPPAAPIITILSLVDRLLPKLSKELTTFFLLVEISTFSNVPPEQRGTRNSVQWLETLKPTILELRDISLQLFLEPEGRTGYWLRGHEGETNYCFSKFQVVGQKYRDLKKIKLVKASLWSFFAAKKPALFATSGL